MFEADHGWVLASTRRAEDQLGGNFFPRAGFQEKWTPFSIISRIIFWLSNNFDYMDSGDLQPREIMFWLSHRVPPSFLEAFLRIDFPSVYSSWKKLLKWTVVFDKRRVFVSLMTVAIDDADWIGFHGARALVSASLVQLPSSLCQAHGERHLA